MDHVHKGHCNQCGEAGLPVITYFDGEYDPTFCKECLKAMIAAIVKFEEEDK